MANRTITIWVKTSSKGRPIAHYWGAARRWLPVSVAEAELAISTGTYRGCKAVKLGTTSDPLPAGYVHTSVDGDIWSV